MTAPPRISSETLNALELARDQHRKRHELRGCHSCTSYFPNDGTCRADSPTTKGFPVADGHGCAKWDPIYAPGKVKWTSPTTDADEAFLWVNQQQQQEDSHVGTQE